MRTATIYITGASRGLGAALAIAYAEPGRTLLLAARDQRRLHDVAAACRAKGADVHCAVLDIRDPDVQIAFLDSLPGHKTLDLAICNAGVFSGRSGERAMETPEAARDVVDINLWGTIATAHAAAEVMSRHRHGRIALISSLAASHPLADAAAYSASKAGVSAYARGLRELLAPGIAVSLVLPGHIRTDQTARHEGVLTGIISPERAAAKIMRGLERGRAEIVFPRHLHWLGLAGRLLPYRVAWYLNRPQRFTVAAPPDEKKEADVAPGRHEI